MLAVHVYVCVRGQGTFVLITCLSETFACDLEGHCMECRTSHLERNEMNLLLA